MENTFSPIQEINQIYNPLIAIITASYINRPESLETLSIQEYILYFCKEYQKVNNTALQTKATMDLDGNYHLPR